MTHSVHSPSVSVPPLPEVFCEALSTLLGARFSQGEAIRLQHGRDESVHPPMPPQAVAFVETTEEVAAVVKLCARHGVPVIPFGAGSSVEGHILAPQGGISLDLSAMNRALSIQGEDLTATVQAGMTRKQLNDELKGTGLFFPIDPGADASLGGMASTRASGTNAVRYGTMKENVLALTVVTPQGDVIHTGGRARKSSAGYDLTRLYVGAEGTLGVITELTVRLYPIPEAISSAVCAFPSVDAAVAAVIQTIQLGIPVARIELLDAVTLQAVNRYSKTQLAEQPTLFFEFHGSPGGVAEQAETVQEITQEFGGTGFDWATRPEDRTRLWQARHDAYFACLQLKPGSRCFPTDVCVPISRLATCITETNGDIAQVSLPVALFGHVGDGNFHLVVLVDPDNPKEMAEADWLNQRVVERAIGHDGTCTGEHGIGLGKMHWLEREHGAGAMATMAALKQALDPQNIMNPGKILVPSCLNGTRQTGEIA